MFQRILQIQYFMEKLILFDFDGVLVSTFELSYRLFKEQIPTLTRSEYRKWFDENVYAYLAEKKIQLDMPRFFARYAESLKRKRLSKGWRDVLPALRGAFSMAIVSSMHEEPIEGYLTRSGVRPLFGQVWGVQKHASKVEKIQALLAEHEVDKKHCWFVTDTLGDLREAEKAGIQSIAISSGFHSSEHLKAGAARRVIDTPQQLLDFFSGV